ncbi:MAG: hypothetical protein GX573_26455 [Chloroflexi bacterium]|nr:hypothetical protein [Chloroflexota bacterium]
MDLEQRVIALEQELQILKNQIQATLLDIQEHLLTNAYPSLRAEAEPTRLEPAPVKTISVKPRGQTGTEEDAPDVPQPDSKPPIRQVSLEDVQPTRQPPAPALPPERAHTHPSLENARPQVDAPCTRLDPVYTEPEPDPAPPEYRAGPPSHRKNGTSPQPKVTPFVVDDDLPPAAAADNTPISRMDWATLEQLEQWTNRRLNQFGPRRTRELIKQYAAEGRIAPNVKDSLLQLVSIIAGETILPDRETPPLHQSVSPDYTGALPQDVEDGAYETISPNLILRLIAGIASTGTGNSRSKKHG